MNEIISKGRNGFSGINWLPVQCQTVATEIVSFLVSYFLSPQYGLKNVSSFSDKGFGSDFS